MPLRIERVCGGDRGAIVCLHAMMTDGRYFGAQREDSFAADLARRGFDVFVPHFRGHADLPDQPRDWSFDDLVELDLPAIVDACAHAERCSPRDLVLLGHSLGGLVACAAIGTARIPPPRALLLAATSVWLNGSDGPLARRALMGVYRGVTRVVGKAPIRALRLGSADEARTYVMQLTGWARSARWTSLRGVDYQAALTTIDVPARAWAGAGDWMCRPADADAIAKRIPTCAPLDVIGRARGDALDPDHFELFTRPALTRFRDAIATAASA